MGLFVDERGQYECLANAAHGQAETTVEQLSQQVTELQAMSEKLENAEKRSSTDSQTIAELQQEVEKLVAREAGLRNAAESAASAAQRKQDKLTRLTGAFTDLKSELTAAKDSLVALSAEKTDMEAKLHARIELECARKARTQLELDRANLEIAELEDRVSELQRAHEEEKEQHEVSLKEEAAKVRAEEARAMEARTAEHRRRCQEEVMRDFFFMLVMSIKVKLQREILAGKVVDRSATDLYNAMKVEYEYLLCSFPQFNNGYVCLSGWRCLRLSPAFVRFGRQLFTKRQSINGLCLRLISTTYGLD